MATLEEIDRIQANLDKCDASLKDKPQLASIYNIEWRKKFRKDAIAVNKPKDVPYPMGYGAPIFEKQDLCPHCYQNRLEKGAEVLLTKLNNKDKNRLIKRMRELDPATAEEELLLACGFSLEFGKDTILGLPDDLSQPRPEFYVSVENQHNIAIEAKGLYDSKEVQELNKSALSSGQNSWISSDPKIGDSSRVQISVTTKILESARHNPCVTVFTIYAPFDFLPAIDLTRQMAIDPSVFISNITQDEYPLALALVSYRFICGVWFNSSAVNKFHISNTIKERIRTAVKGSFWPRQDGIFLHEMMTDCEHNTVVERVLSRGR